MKYLDSKLAGKVVCYKYSVVPEVPVIVTSSMGNITTYTWRIALLLYTCYYFRLCSNNLEVRKVLRRRNHMWHIEVPDRGPALSVTISVSLCWSLLIACDTQQSSPLIYQYTGKTSWNSGQDSTSWNSGHNWQKWKGGGPGNLFCMGGGGVEAEYLLRYPAVLPITFAPQWPQSSTTVSLDTAKIQCREQEITYAWNKYRGSLAGQAVAVLCKGGRVRVEAGVGGGGLYSPTQGDWMLGCSGLETCMAHFLYMTSDNGHRNVFPVSIFFWQVASFSGNYSIMSAKTKEWDHFSGISESTDLIVKNFVFRWEMDFNI